MAKYKSIEEYRSKKKRKSFLKKIFLFLLIIGILCLLLYVLKGFKETAIDGLIQNKPDGTTQGTESFPIIIKNEPLQNIYGISSHLGILTKTNIYTYNENGKRLNKQTHGYSNPVVREGNKRVLIYDRGGNGFRVDTQNSTIGTKIVEGQIIYAQIHTNGNVAVVTTHERYASVITVYDASLSELYQYSVTERISNVCFAPDNRHILATAIVTINGKLGANLYELNINDSEDISKQTIMDILPLNISYSENSNITIIGKDSLITINAESKAETRYEYSGNLHNFINGSVNESIIITDNYSDVSSLISVVGADGIVKNATTINDTVLDVYSDGSRILVLGKNLAYNYDSTLQLLNQFELSKSFQKIMYNGNSVYFMATDCVEKEKID